MEYKIYKIQLQISIQFKAGHIFFSTSTTSNLDFLGNSVYMKDILIFPHFRTSVEKLHLYV